MAFDFTCLVTFHANSISAISAALGARLVTIFRSSALTIPPSRDCARNPPATDLILMLLVLRSGMSPVINSRRLGFAAIMALALSLASGAITTSVKMLATTVAVSASSGRFMAMMPPKALIGSAANAVCHAATRFSPLATPQGLACLIMAIVGLSNSATSSKAASVSLMLLYDNGLPCICKAKATPGRLWPVL